jgi:hypothetical protein
MAPLGPEGKYIILEWATVEAAAKDSQALSPSDGAPVASTPAVSPGA